VLTRKGDAVEGIEAKGVRNKRAEDLKIVKVESG
jgi:hypothetical protein